jgi:hypothetical protein
VSPNDFFGAIAKGILIGALIAFLLSPLLPAILTMGMFIIPAVLGTLLALAVVRAIL